MNVRIFKFFLIVLGIRTNWASVLFYNTELSVGAEEFNCIYFIKDSTVKFCIRPGKKLSLSEEFSNCSKGVTWRYSRLLALEVLPSEILLWSSSVEKVDDYARIFYNRSEKLDEDAYLCNCTQPGSFGKNCEYELLFDNLAFSNAIHITFAAKRFVEGHQTWGDISCYDTLACDHGMLCLDWRNICDGQQNCMKGLDEENCDILEFNECEKDEYRCVNGMCIPEEYWLDGKSDIC